MLPIIRMLHAHLTQIYRHLLRLMFLIDSALAHDDCKVIAVFAMLADKDIQGVVDTLGPCD